MTPMNDEQIGAFLQKASSLVRDGKTAEAYAIIEENYDALPREVQGDIALIALAGAVRESQTREIIADAQETLVELIEKLEKLREIAVQKP